MKMGLKYNFEYPIDSPSRTPIHKRIIEEKKFLRLLYELWYHQITSEVKNLPKGLLIELGCGAGFLKKIEPKILCSDIIPQPSNDLTFSALNMPFENNSVSGIFMIDTFHHLPDSKLFLSEANRVLKTAGKIIMIEPVNSLWGRFIYRNFHHEPFDIRANWKISVEGPLTGANGALPWIVFIRDKSLFQEQFPNLKIERVTYQNPLLYFLSGGLTYRQMLPDFTYSFIRFLDNLLPVISKQFSMFMRITIVKDGQVRV